MAAAKSRHRRHPFPEKRRIVELALREGASIEAIAREQGVHSNTIRQWKALYRGGIFGAVSAPAPGKPAPTSGKFVPVTITSAPHVARNLGDRSIVHITLASGSTMRIETGALDGGLIRALVAQLQQ
jgi:transposase-like protein